MRGDHSMTACPVCDSVPRGYRHPWLLRCACGLLSASFPIAIPSTPTETRLDESQRASGLEPLRRINNASLLRAIARHTKRGASLLDVGSGPGFLLDQAMADGFRVEGIEPDANVFSATQGRGVPVRNGFFPDVLRPGETFDVIVFNDVLEHIPNLSGTLEAAYKALNPGGVLCLNCPDKRGLFFRMAAALDRLGVSAPYSRLWQQGLPSPHLWYFSPPLLNRVAERANFALLQEVRLETIELHGLWARIRYADEGLLTSITSYVFAAASYPLAQLLPSDATACLYRGPL